MVRYVIGRCRPELQGRGSLLGGRPLHKTNMTASCSPSSRAEMAARAASSPASVTARATTWSSAAGATEGKVVAPRRRVAALSPGGVAHNVVGDTEQPWEGTADGADGTGREAAKPPGK